MEKEAKSNRSLFGKVFSFVILIFVIHLAAIIFYSSDTDETANAQKTNFATRPVIETNIQEITVEKVKATPATKNDKKALPKKEKGIIQIIPK